jgi:hypothetical protein
MPPPAPPVPWPVVTAAPWPDSSKLHAQSASDTPTRGHQPRATNRTMAEAKLGPTTHLVQVIQEVSGILVDAVRAGALQFLLPVAA